MLTSENLTVINDCIRNAHTYVANVLATISFQKMDRENKEILEELKEIQAHMEDAAYRLVTSSDLINVLIEFAEKAEKRKKKGEK